MDTVTTPVTDTGAPRPESEQTAEPAPAPTRSSPSPQVRRNRTGVGICGLVLSAVYLWNSRDLPAGTLEEPGAGIFPWAVGAGLALTSLAVLVEARRGRGDADLATLETPSRTELRKAAVLFAGFAALVALVPVVGVFAAGATFIALVARWMTGTGWPRAVLVAVLVAGAVYLLFVLYLRVPLPNGIFE
jgi:putative tricarboxylic transport membrane protein